MSFLFSHPTQRTFSPAPVYTEGFFGEPVYEGYYDDRELYLYALAAKKQQRRQEQYAYAIAQAALAQQQHQERQRRRQEYEYAAALAIEEHRHRAVVSQIAERRALAWNQQRAQLAKEAERQRAICIAKAKAEQALRLAEEQERRRRASLEQAHQQQRALAFLSALFNQDAPPDSNKPEEKQSKGKGREVPTSHYTPDNAAQSLPPPQPVEVGINVAGPSNSQQSDSVPAPASPARSLSAISTIEYEFTTLRDSFTFPVSLDFSPSSSPSDNVPQLVYNSTNLPVRVYEQQLTNLLTKLDEVDSEGVQSVRDARKKLVRDIEQVLEEMDKRKEEEWVKTLALHKNAEIVVESSPAEAEKAIARADEELEYVDAPVQEESSPVPHSAEPSAPETSSADIIGYDVSPVPAPLAIEIDSTPATVAEDTTLSDATLDTSVLIPSDEPFRSASPSPYNAPTPIDTDAPPQNEAAVQPAAAEDMQSSSDEEEAGSDDDGVVLTADDGTLTTEEVEHQSENESDFEML